MDSEADPKWLWKGRRVYMFDGTTVSMPDTPENLKAYSKTYNQKPGLGFPIARVGAIAIATNSLLRTNRTTLNIAVFVVLVSDSNTTIRARL